MPTERMRVLKYLPEKLYGFAGNGNGLEVFFHLGAFRPGPELQHHLPLSCISCATCGPLCDPQVPPPPILGESVEVTYESEEGSTKAPRATKVERLVTVTPLLGRVESMDSQRGFGFLVSEAGDTYHLHRSEIADGHLPVPGQQMVFYPGTRQGKPRACHVRLCRWARRRPTASCSGGEPSKDSTSL